jgi:hypothetical protein
MHFATVEGLHDFLSTDKRYPDKHFEQVSIVKGTSQLLIGEPNELQEFALEILK